MASLAASAFWDTRYAEVGGAPQSPHTAAIHSTVRENIPDDVATILDAGCGALMTFLARENRYTIEGVDQSAEDRTLQRTLKFFGVHRPANVVTLIEVN
jgi:2-polyprenyl-3-methyl-5-hydroxy-6-metoxy-1,4-benzoquinol methylase